jgi:hypothetical protein
LRLSARIGVRPGLVERGGEQFALAVDDAVGQAQRARVAFVARPPAAAPRVSI